MNHEIVATKILTLDDGMRYVRFIDMEGGLIYEQVKKGKTLLQDREGLGKFSSELPIMKQMQELFDESLGKVRFMHMIRDKVHQFVYYVDSVIVYVTCERDTDPHRMPDIISKIDSSLYSTQ
ncbi:MAG: hypothetical protein ACREBI_05210 [Nitrosotalea sp.]